MTLSFNTFAGHRVKKLAICSVVLSLAWTVYFLNRSSAQRISKSQASQAAALSEGPRTPSLRITSVIQHGRICEIQGSTDPGAVVMINGQTATTLFDGNSFKHFVGPMHPGTSIISITAQDSQGGVNTQQVAFTTN